MCEARFAFAGIAEPGTIWPSPRPGRDDLSRLSARTRSDEEGLDRMTAEVFDANLFMPTALHDASYADGIVAIALVDLHL